MKDIPKLEIKDLAFGNIKHLPRWEEIPKEFKDMNDRTRQNRYISKWFYQGLSEKEINDLKPKSNIDKIQAMRAIGAILQSFEPKHEHKTAGAAYLLSEWFKKPKKINYN